MPWGDPEGDGCGVANVMGGRNTSESTPKELVCQGERPRRSTGESGTCEEVVRAKAGFAKAFKQKKGVREVCRSCWRRRDTVNVVPDGWVRSEVGQRHGGGID